MVEQHQGHRDRPDAVERRDRAAVREALAAGADARSEARRLGVPPGRLGPAGPLTGAVVLADTPLSSCPIGKKV
ncbi:MAG TPA: hypothetical protein VK069_03610 [Mycolicibacillus parakoreensis]|nr:hypothetical protein [Mycolicibacillus parakoreensis]